MIDLSTDLGGGYTAVYYPEGVISQEEYNCAWPQIMKTKRMRRMRRRTRRISIINTAAFTSKTSPGTATKRM